MEGAPAHYGHRARPAAEPTAALTAAALAAAALAAVALAADAAAAVAAALSTAPAAAAGRGLLEDVLVCHLSAGARLVPKHGRPRPLEPPGARAFLAPPSCPSLPSLRSLLTSRPHRSWGGGSRERRDGPELRPGCALALSRARRVEREERERRPRRTCGIKGRAHVAPACGSRSGSGRGSTGRAGRSAPHTQGLKIVHACCN